MTETASGEAARIANGARKERAALWSIWQAS